MHPLPRVCAVVSSPTSASQQLLVASVRAVQMRTGGVLVAALLWVPGHGRRQLRSVSCGREQPSISVHLESS